MFSEVSMDGKIRKRALFGWPLGSENGSRCQSVLDQFAGQGTVAGLRFVSGTHRRAFARRSSFRCSHLSFIAFRVL